ncbi:MAG TPA: helix-turn-helix domain-containing protein [Chitinophaga sp.]|uniref:winged helix-turn-helix transcriptional regulator n=1 Tax=Chitinophaga sp. TaxID=1869181 RepID=UPI002CBCDB84|nr:helix-turn-helix domain-containing protein [Chitinophaga sp.]HVI45056.1 helix-turn-helix domain-containing protein [Chitinophaga sp.]
MYERKIPVEKNCGMVIIMEIIGGKWKPCLIHNISRGIRRPGELQRCNPAATRRVLSQQLKELEQHGVIYKVVYAAVPPKIEYYLTDKGKSLLPVINTMEEWGTRFLDNTAEIEQGTLSVG